MHSCLLCTVLAVQSCCAFSQVQWIQNDSCTFWTQQIVWKMVFLVWVEKTQIDRCRQFSYPFSRKTDDHVFSIANDSMSSHCGNGVFHIVPNCCIPTWDCILNAEGKYFAIEWRQVSLLVDVKVLCMKSTEDKPTLSFLNFIFKLTSSHIN